MAPVPLIASTPTLLLPEAQPQANTETLPKIGLVFDLNGRL